MGKEVVEIRMHNRLAMNDVEGEQSQKRWLERAKSAKAAQMTDAERRELKCSIMRQEIESELDKIKRCGDMMDSQS